MAIDSYLGGTLLICTSVALSIAGLRFTRKIMDVDKLHSAHEVSGYLLSVIGTLYAVLLGLVVVDAMQKFQIARDTTEHEADALADVYVYSARLPDQKRSAIQALCKRYVDGIVNQEWDLMDEGQYSPDCRRTAVKILDEACNFEPLTENQKALYPMIVSAASDVWQSRRSRINIAVNGVPAVEWVTLILGGIITVMSTYFFEMKHPRLQVLMTGMVAALISLNLFLLVLFGYPFSGSLSVHKDCFTLDQGIFENRVSSAPPSQF